MHHLRNILVVAGISSCLINAQDGFRVYPYLQNPAPDAMTILWFSKGSSPGQFTIWKPGSPEGTINTSSPDQAETLTYPTWEDTTFFEGMAPLPSFRHRVRLEELDPFTTYGYMVVQDTDTFRSEFRTAPDRDTSIRFVVYGDCETEPESTGNFSNWPDTVTGELRNYLFDQTTGYHNNLAVIRSRDPDLVLIAGDLVQHGGEQRHWDEFWRHNTSREGEKSLAGRIPVLAALGNHDYYEG
ncbi:MAG: metallophosphoesterase, partial [Bacteroidales bacterium]|nr:metallophosphoesterase [Bacteroidales bacterium]